MKKILLIALLIGTTISCEDFEGWNVDTKKPSEVPASYLITSAQRDLSLRMTSTSVNYNIFKLFAQNWNQTQYTDESNYDLTTRDVGGNFSLYLYRDVLMDLEEAKKIVSTDEFLDNVTKTDQIAVADIMQVYVWHVLVDTYGYIPYTEALQGGANLVPVYDADDVIYTDLLNRLEADVSKLSSTGDSYGGADLLYGGSTLKWKRFANSLRLKMAVRISDFDNAKAQSVASDAISEIFDSSADNAAFPFEVSPPNTNPIWTSLVQSGRNDYVVANTFVDLITPLNDPRTSVFLADNITPYEGGVYGTGSSYTDFTHIGDIWHTPDLEGIIMSYSEVQFLVAEARERNLIPGNAEDAYNEAITASIQYWGGTAEEAATYLAQTSVAYATAGATWKEKIGNQKYLSLYGRGFEAWSSWRLLDYPNTMMRPVSGEAVPRRYTYGNDDADLNETNYTAAAAAMGGDEKSSRVFWDIKGVGN